MDCVVCKGTSHPGYFRYSWDHDSLLDYPAHEIYQAQPAPSCPGYDTVAFDVTKLASLRVVQHVPKTGTPPPVETLLDSGTRARRWLQHCQLHVRNLTRCRVLRIKALPNRKLSFLARALLPRYSSRFFSSHSSRIPSRLELTSMSKRSSGSSITPLCRRSLLLRERSIRNIQCTPVHCPRQRMSSRRFARFGQRFLFSAAANAEIKGSTARGAITHQRGCLGRG